MCGPFLEAVKETERQRRIRLGKTLNDSVRVFYAKSVTAQRTRKEPVILLPDPKDVQREYESMRIVGDCCSGFTKVPESKSSATKGRSRKVAAKRSRRTRPPAPKGGAKE